MTLSVSAWDTQVRADVIQGFTESGVVPDGSFIKKVHTNQASLIFPKLNRRFPENTPDGGAALGFLSETEPGITLALDEPLKLHEDIPDSAMNTQQGTIEGDFSVRLGRDLRYGHDNRLIAFATNQGIARSSFAGRVQWQNVPATQDTTEKRGDAAGEVLSDCLKNFADAEVGDTTRKYVVFEPDLFYNLLNSKFVRSRDFTTDADNSGNVMRIRFGGLTVSSAVSIFNSDQDGSAGTRLFGAAAKYLANFSTERVSGVAWSEDALAVGYVEPLNVRSSYEASREGLLIRARTHFGTTATQDAFVYVSEVIA